MNLCTCCFDEVTGTPCGCEEQHEQDPNIMTEARAYLNGQHEMQEAEQWSFHCFACGRPTYGTAYYYND